MTQKKTVIEPDLADLFSIFKQDLFSSLNCMKVGQIQSFDVSKHTAQVQVLLKRVLPDESIQPYPILLDVPVVTLQGGGGSLQFPITAGDQCLIFFNDRRIDEWFQNGAASAPGSPRMHDMSDGFALVGVNALNSSLSAAPTNKVVLAYKGSRFELTATGWNIVGTGGAEIDLDTKVGIKNSTTSLATLITNFITALEALTVQDDEGGAVLPLTAAAIATLEAQKALFLVLLE